MLPRISKVECLEADFLLFSSRDLISNTLFRTGQWEWHLIELSRFIVSVVDRPLILDVGANLGAYSIPLARHIQSVGGEVIGFEPQRIVYYQLCGNIILNRLDNYYAIQSAVGQELGEIEIPEFDFTEAHNIGGFSIDVKFRQLNGTESFIKNQSARRVPLVTLNSLILERPPSLIKIDVEGHELRVLLGANEFLDRNSYPPILFECWSEPWFDSERHELLSHIVKLGYEVVKIGLSDYLAQHPRHSRKVKFDLDPNGVINMIRER
jgi:FkbM family methyltransferase